MDRPSGPNFTRQLYHRLVRNVNETGIRIFFFSFPGDSFLGESDNFLYHVQLELKQRSFLSSSLVVTYSCPLIHKGDKQGSESHTGSPNHNVSKASLGPDFLVPVEGYIINNSEIAGLI